MTEISDDALRNRQDWTEANAEYTDAQASERWAAQEITWGCFGVPEAGLGTLGDVAGLDVVELGCGTAYVSAWLARRGARPVGVDVTPAQLATARRCQKEFGLDFPLVEASAEDVPLPDESFDLAVSEYGASIWCDPHRWIPEAHRLLRPGGRLWFLRNSTLSVLCFPERGPADDDAAATAARARPGRVAGLGRRRVAAAARRAVPAADAHGLRRRRPRGAVPARRRRRSRVLRRLLRRLVAAVAGRGDLGGDEAQMTAAPGERARHASPLRLASTSPQRRAILEQLRIPFEVVVPSYEEHDPPDADADALVRDHAVGKARSVHVEGRVTLGVDTTVQLDGRVYGKAADADGRRAHAAAALGTSAHGALGPLPARAGLRARPPRAHAT